MENKKILITNKHDLFPTKVPVESKGNFRGREVIIEDKDKNITRHNLFGLILAHIGILTTTTGVIVCASIACLNPALTITMLVGIVICWVLFPIFAAITLMMAECK